MRKLASVLIATGLLFSGATAFAATEMTDSQMENVVAGTYCPPSLPSLTVKVAVKVYVALK